MFSNRCIVICVGAKYGKKEKHMIRSTLVGVASLGEAGHQPEDIYDPPTETNTQLDEAQLV